MSVWRTVRFFSGSKPNRLNLAGPLALILIILLWTVGLVLGWACLLHPHLPQDFLLSTGMVAERNDGFLDAVYVSVVALATLGYGEITPQATWLRLLAPLEALIGFALLTASVTWLMSLYPALARRRYLARQVDLINRLGERDDVATADRLSSWQETELQGSHQSGRCCSR